MTRTLGRLSAREGVRAQCYDTVGRFGTRHDPMAATDARIDQEARLAACRDADLALVEAASDVICGSDRWGSGCVCSMLGAAYADALWWRYCAAATWEEVAGGCGMSEGWCRQIGVPTALDLCDAYGLWALAHGLRGLAE